MGAMSLLSALGTLLGRCIPRRPHAQLPQAAWVYPVPVYWLGAVTNTFVHIIMYSYYAWSSMDSRARQYGMIRTGLVVCATIGAHTTVPAPRGLRHVHAADAVLLQLLCGSVVGAVGGVVGSRHAQLVVLFVDLWRPAQLPGLVPLVLLGEEERGKSREEDCVKTSLPTVVRGVTPSLETRICARHFMIKSLATAEQSKPGTHARIQEAFRSTQLGLELSFLAPARPPALVRHCASRVASSRAWCPPVRLCTLGRPGDSRYGPLGCREAD